ncbi:MAG: hypothetical protein JO023_13505, partial [Chloroflexi bacterium]|nr:hypothetical protein [Chloroflexota bacterium]
MTLAQLRSFSGWVLVVGAIAALVGNTASGVLFPDSSNPAYSTTPLFVPLNLLGAVGAGLLLLGLPGLYASHRLELRVSGFVGIVLIAVTAMMFGIFLGLFTVIVQPFVAVQAPQLMAAQPPVALLVFFVLGTLVEVVGSLLLALPMLRGSMRPRWAGYVLVVSAVLAAVSFFL